MSSRILLPDSVVRQVRAERAVELEMAQRTQVCIRFTEELRKIDRYLELVYWPDTASAPGFIPGRYHIVRHNPNAPGSVEPFVDELGGYREPDSSLFEHVRRCDLWNQEVRRERERLAKRAEDARRRQEEREREEHEAELMERVAAVTRTQVSMNTDTPWTQNASAHARRDAEARRKAGKD